MTKLRPTLAFAAGWVMFKVIFGGAARLTENDHVWSNVVPSFPRPVTRTRCEPALSGAGGLYEKAELETPQRDVISAPSRRTFTLFP